MGTGREIERVPVSDIVFLLQEETAPQTIALLARFGAPGGSPSLEALRGTVAGRLADAPVLRRRVHRPGRWRGRPVWVDDGGFDLADHVRAVAVPGPGDEDAVLAVVGDLLAAPLDQSRPLWELVLLDGTTDGHPWLLWKVHHVVADGERALALLGALVDPGVPAGSGAPGGTGPPTGDDRWRPAPLPTDLALFVDGVGRRLTALTAALRRLAHPAAVAGRLRAGLAQLRTDLRPDAPALPFNRPLGSRRRYLVLRADLAPLHDAARRRRATLNDVAVAAMAAGVHELLRSSRHPTAGLVLQVSVPVSLRRDGNSPDAGNAVGGMRVPVPLDADPSDAPAFLDAVATATRARKAGPGAAAGFAALGSELMPVPLLRALLGRALRGGQRYINVYVSDLVGPRERVALGGVEIAEAFPVGPLSAGVGLGAVFLSYAGRLSATVLTDPEACPRAEVVAAGMERFLRRLAG